jgi:hypothetical protein
LIQRQDIIFRLNNNEEKYSLHYHIFDLFLLEVSVRNIYNRISTVDILLIRHFIGKIIYLYLVLIISETSQFDLSQIYKFFLLSKNLMQR